MVLLKRHHLLALGEALVGDAFVHREVRVALLLACGAQKTLIRDGPNAVAVLPLPIQNLLVEFVFVEFVHLLNF